MHQEASVGFLIFLFILVMLGKPLWNWFVKNYNEGQKDDKDKK